MGLQRETWKIDDENVCIVAGCRGIGGGVVLPLEREIARAAIRGFVGLVGHGGGRKTDSAAQNPDVV